MYLGTALKLAIPFAISDRQAMAEAYGYMGQEAEAAKKACADMLALLKVKPANFTTDQREAARMALLWGEQYLTGFMLAMMGSDEAEFALASKQRKQIRIVRFEHFGQTAIEVAMKDCIEVPIGPGEANDLLLGRIQHVVCPVCSTRTNGASAGDVCLTCKTGVFQ